MLLWQRFSDFFTGCHYRYTLGIDKIKDHMQILVKFGNIFV